MRIPGGQLYRAAGARPCLVPGKGVRLGQRGCSQRSGGCGLFQRAWKPKDRRGWDAYSWGTTLKGGGSAAVPCSRRKGSAGAEGAAFRQNRDESGRREAREKRRLGNGEIAGLRRRPFPGKPAQGRITSGRSRRRGRVCGGSAYPGRAGGRGRRRGRWSGSGGPFWPPPPGPRRGRPPGPGPCPR